MLGLNLNRPRSQWPKKKRPSEPKPRREILVPAAAIDKCRMLTSRSKWCAEASATLTLSLPHGIIVGNQKFNPDLERKAIPVFEDAYEKFIQAIPENDRQFYLDRLFEFNGERAVDAMFSRYAWHMADVFGRDKSIAARTRKRLEEVLGVETVATCLGECKK